MANFYIAVSVKQDRNETTFTERKNPEYNPGYYAFVIRCSENDNLLHSLDCIGGIIHANILPTKKRAEEVAQHWNDCYKANGTYFFAEPKKKIA